MGENRLELHQEAFGVTSEIERMKPEMKNLPRTCCAVKTCDCARAL
jgi:hypothetical protein